MGMPQLAHKRARKSSRTITLVLIGAASLGGCGDSGPPLTRDIYRTRADCAQDWGDERKCEPAATGGSAGGTHYWYGPSYSARPDSAAGHAGTSSAAETITQPRAGSHAIASHVSRGGFGLGASSHSSGS